MRGDGPWRTLRRKRSCAHRSRSVERSARSGDDAEATNRTKKRVERHGERGCRKHKIPLNKLLQAIRALDNFQNRGSRATEPRANPLTAKPSCSRQPSPSERQSSRLHQDGHSQERHAQEPKSQKTCVCLRSFQRLSLTSSKEPHVALIEGKIGRIDPS